MCCEDPQRCACAVLASRPEGQTPAGLADGLRRIGEVSARADACRAEWLAEAERIDAAREQGFSSTTAWLMAISGEPGATCRSRVATAEALQQMPETKAAFASGELSESRVRVLAQAQALAPEPFAQQEAALVAAVAAAPSRQVPQLLAAWKRQTDPQAAEAEAEQLHHRRALHLSADWSHMLRLSGELDPEGGLIVLQALRSLSEAANLDPADSRTPAQCRADALVEICRRHLNGDNGHHQPARLLITIPWNTLQQGQGLVDTETGPLTAQSARRLTCDATVSRVLLDPNSVPVEMGRATRVIPPALRKALHLRDGGCTHPGCDMPARFCDAHHQQHWAQGGQTTMSNLRLLCRHHHRQAHHQPYPRRE